MATSRVPATIDALVAMLTAADLNVHDGPLVTGDFSPAVWVGYDGAGSDSELRSASSTQSWAELGAKRRNEVFDIICAVNALVGTTNSDARNAVYALYSTVETVLRSNPSMGQTPPFVAEIAAGDLYTEPTENGVQCRLVFTVHVTTRI